VTSTIVDTKGADELAGSAPNLRRINGNIAPTKDPHRTTPTKELPIAAPYRYHASPYVSLNTSSTPILKKPKTPKITPSSNPERISRFMTIHQSRRVTSPMAIA